MFTKVLYLHRTEIIDQHREQVWEFFDSKLPECEIEFASAAGSTDHPDPWRHEVVICPAAPWVAEQLSRLPNLQWVHFTGAGVDQFPELDDLRQRVLISNSAGVNSRAIAEYVLAGVLYFGKQFNRFGQQQANREWARSWLDELTAKTVVVVGVGNIGREVARLASSFEMSVVGVARTAREIPGFERVVAIDQLDEELPAADYLVLAIPLSPQTEGLFDQRRLALLNTNCVVVNVSRGAVIDEVALIDCLKTNRIRGAVLDVFQEEPLPRSSPLWGLENVLVTPHVAGTTEHYLQRMLGIFGDNWNRLKSEGKLATPVVVG